MNRTSARVDALTQRLARVTGDDVEIAVERALSEWLSSVAPQQPKDRHAVLQRLFERVAQMPVRDTRSIDEIVGRGTNGQPT